MDQLDSCNSIIVQVLAMIGENALTAGMEVPVCISDRCLAYGREVLHAQRKRVSCTASKCELRRSGSESANSAAFHSSNARSGNQAWRQLLDISRLQVKGIRRQGLSCFFEEE